MDIAVDSCSVILLAKASVLEACAGTFNLIISRAVYREISEGREKKFADALLTERLVEEKRIAVVMAKSRKLVKKLQNEFNMGAGEAETISLVLTKQCAVVCTDNRQGRNAANIYNVKLVGGIEMVVNLVREGQITKEKARSALAKLREYGWYNEFLIEKAFEEVGT